MLILIGLHGDLSLCPLDLGHADLREWQTFLALIHGGQDFRIHLCQLAHLVGQIASLVECMQGAGRVKVVHFHRGLNVYTRILAQQLVGQAGGALLLHMLYVILQNLILLWLYDFHVWHLPGCLQHLVVEILLILIFGLNGRPRLLGLRPLASHLFLANLDLRRFLSNVELLRVEVMVVLFFLVGPAPSLILLSEGDGKSTC